MTTGTSQTVTVEAVTSGSPSSTLLPGGTADLLVQLQNSASTAVTIVAISQNGPATPVGGNGCTASNDAVTVPSQDRAQHLCRHGHPTRAFRRSRSHGLEFG